jgi:Metal-dependent amidase/aminoacylase/carboxypeptidase
LDRDLLDKLTAWRRHLHAHPELGRHEKMTSAFVQEKLTELGVPSSPMSAATVWSLR